MSPIEIGGIGVACLIALLLSGIPIGVSLGLVSFIGIAAIRGWVAAFSIAGDIPYTFTASWSLTAIPMFIFMGALASNGGLIVSLFRVGKRWLARSEEHTSELQSLMRISYAVFCLKKKKKTKRKQQD